MYSIYYQNMVPLPMAHSHSSEESYYEAEKN